MLVTVYVNMVTNPIPAGQTTNGQNFYQISSCSRIEQYLPDGGLLMCSTMAHFGYKTNASAVGRIPITPPIPNKTVYGKVKKPKTTTPYAFGRIANGAFDDLNPCFMFRTDFSTETNRIYGLEWTSDFVNWMLCPPEIDGTGETEYFFDVLTNPFTVYRIASRPGALPL